MFKKSLQKPSAKYSVPPRESYIHVDLGSFGRGRGADYAIDLKKNPNISDCKQFLLCHLGFQKIPLQDFSVDLVTAFDLLEHIPKVLWFYDMDLTKAKDDIFHSPCVDKIGDVVVIRPLIFLFNEIYRVLKDKGQFFSCTPSMDASISSKNIKALISINQDPTHVATLCRETFVEYFCGNPDKPEYFQQQLSCGIRTAFKALPDGARLKYPLPEGWFFSGHDESHLSIILEKPSWEQKDLKMFSSSNVNS
jgi:hypothetical protein